MKWNVGWAALLGAFLPVPLVLVLVVFEHGAREARVPKNISPVLSYEERLQRVTFMRRCEKSTDCEPPLGCWKHRRLAEPVCVDSDCVTDEQCEQGYTCQALKTEGQGPIVRLCMRDGVRQEGEQCLDLPHSKEEACAPGLRCFRGWCGRPCLMENPGLCPAGFFCADDVAGAVCLPRCDAQSCPGGKQCVRFDKAGVPSISACVVVHGPQCQQTPCPEGQECILSQTMDKELEVSRPDEVWMTCRQRCGKNGPACPAGFTCFLKSCRRLCEPNEPGTCGPQERCDHNNPKDPSTCRFDY